VQAPLVQPHCGSPRGPVWHAVMLPACVGQLPLVSPHEPVNAQPADAPQAPAPDPPSTLVPLGQVAEEHEPVHTHSGSPPDPTVLHEDAVTPVPPPFAVDGQLFVIAHNGVNVQLDALAPAFVQVLALVLAPQTPLIAQVPV